MYRSIKKRIHKSVSTKKLGGFTLTELIVTASIMTLIVTVLVRGQSTYTEKISLVNAADKFTLLVRQAQTNGIAVRELEPGSNAFPSAYGVAVKVSGPSLPPTYLAFADNNSDSTYQGSWTICMLDEWFECLESVSLDQGIVIDQICLVFELGPENCINGGTAHMTYSRPNTKAEFVVTDNGGLPLNTINVKSLKFRFVKPTNPLLPPKYVSVYKSGQISVEE